MTRAEVEQRFLSIIDEDLAALEKSSKVAEQGATHSESKQEGKYDTRAIEASYLAGAQKNRLEKLRLKARALKQEFLKYQPSQKVTTSSCVDLACGESRKIFLISMVVGGYTFVNKNIKVSLVSTDSPLVKDLLDLEIGDEVEIAGDEWELINIF